jgi:hypothetical protein
MILSSSKLHICKKNVYMKKEGKKNPSSLLKVFGS